MPTLAEQTKTAKNTRFATIGRALADAHRAGHNTGLLVGELANLRRAEHQISDRQVAFAGLARQIGDAAGQGGDLADLLARLAELRRTELSGPATG